MEGQSDCVWKEMISSKVYCSNFNLNCDCRALESSLNRDYIKTLYINLVNIIVELSSIFKRDFICTLYSAL